jgi:ubiquinone/menaquinone biosynthesis C-methylase UbiE
MFLDYSIAALAAINEGERMYDNAYERAVLAFRTDPKLHDWELGSFLEEDFARALERYSESEEFVRCWNVLEPHLESGTRLLDIGAGRGLTSITFARKGIPVTSIEYDPSDIVGVGALAKSQERLGVPLSGVRGDVLALPFRDECFDVAFSRSVLHHVNDMGRGLKEVWRVLKPGGVFLAYNEHIIGPFSDGQKFLRSHPTVPYGVNEHAYPVFTYWSKFRSAGFRSLRFFHCSRVLEFPNFLRRAMHRPAIARWVEFPGIGAVFARLLYVSYTLLCYYPRYFIVAEGGLPSVAIVAHKPVRV